MIDGFFYEWENNENKELAIVRLGAGTETEKLELFGGFIYLLSCNSSEAG